MNNESAAAHTLRIVDGLTSLPDVTPLQVGAGQVLVYAGHLVQGLYVVLSGTVGLYDPPRDAPGRPWRRVDAAAGPIVIPALDELDLPATLLARVDASARLLFVPRSLTRSAVVRALLDGGPLTQCSLQKNLPRTHRTTRPA